MKREVLLCMTLYPKSKLYSLFGIVFLIRNGRMSTLFLPDLQYHFQDMDPNAVVNHAYNMLLYIFDNANPIKLGDHVDGIKDGKMSTEVQWKVQYE